MADAADARTSARELVLRVRAQLRLLRRAAAGAADDVRAAQLHVGEFAARAAAEVAEALPRRFRVFHAEALARAGVARRAGLAGRALPPGALTLDAVGGADGKASEELTELLCLFDTDNRALRTQLAAARQAALDSDTRCAAAASGAGEQRAAAARSGEQLRVFERLLDEARDNAVAAQLECIALRRALGDAQHRAHDHEAAHLRALQQLLLLQRDATSPLGGRRPSLRRRASLPSSGTAGAAVSPDDAALSDPEAAPDALLLTPKQPPVTPSQLLRGSFRRAATSPPQAALAPLLPPGALVSPATAPPLSSPAPDNASLSLPPTVAATPETLEALAADLARTQRDAVIAALRRALQQLARGVDKVVVTDARPPSPRSCSPPVAPAAPRPTTAPTTVRARVSPPRASPTSPVAPSDGGGGGVVARLYRLHEAWQDRWSERRDALRRAETDQREAFLAPLDAASSHHVTLTPPAAAAALSPPSAAACTMSPSPPRESLGRSVARSVPPRVGGVSALGSAPLRTVATDPAPVPVGSPRQRASPRFVYTSTYDVVHIPVVARDHWASSSQIAGRQRRDVILKH